MLPQVRQAWERNGFKTAGTWEEVFGRSVVNKSDWHAFSYLTEEIFMAWNYARYVGHVAAAGKAEYPIPMYMNTWIKQEISGWPGAYPSGGPQSHLIHVYHAGGPAIDILSPDCHLPNFTDVRRGYTQAGNPLFVPESSSDARGAAHALWTMGNRDAIGFSPFGIDRNAGPNLPLAQGLRSDRPSCAAGPGAPGHGHHDGGRTGRRGAFTDRAAGELRPRGADDAADVRGPAPAATNCVAALFICTAPDDYVVVAQNVNVYFTAATNPSDSVGLATVEEGVYADGKWIPGRRLNGDETPEWKALKFRGDNYSIQHVKLYRYQ